jgi:hypothetical protein
MFMGQLYPDGDFSREMELDGWARSFQPDPTGESSKDASPLESSLPTHNEPGSLSDDSEDSSGTDAVNGDLRNHLQMLGITRNARRYFGKSSGISLLRSALSAKSKASSGGSPGIDSERRLQRRHDFWHLRPVCFRLSITFFSHCSDRPASVGT